jgi:hypothetical protein
MRREKEDPEKWYQMILSFGVQVAAKLLHK